MAHPYDDLFQAFPDFGRVAAFLRQVGGQEVVEGVLTGDLTVERVGQTLQIKEAVRPLFDKNGRRIPPRGLVANVCDPDREFHLVQPQPEINLLERLERAVRHFPHGTSFAAPDEFCQRSQMLYQQIKADEQLANLLKGVHLPVCLPWMTVPDYGQVLEEIFIASAGRAYQEQFPERPFTNCRQGELGGQVTILPGTRHERLTVCMADGPVVGIYFPNPFQGFSVHAQREQMAILPESLLLAGALDTATAWTMYPDVLARDFKTTGCDCAAVQWQSSGASLVFKAYGDKADFDGRTDLAHAYGDYSGGLFFVG